MVNPIITSPKNKSPKQLKNYSTQHTLESQEDKNQNQVQPIQHKQPQIKTNKTQQQINHWKVYLHCLFIAQGCLYFGYSMGQLNLSFPRLVQVYDLDEDSKSLYQGLLSSAIHLGGIFGSLLTGYFLKNYGERKTAIKCDIVGVINSLIFMIPNVYVGILARLIMGFLGGVNLTLVALFMRQISPIKITGKTGSFHGIFVGFGIFFSYVLGLGFPLDEEKLENSGQLYWRFMLGFPLITCLIRIIGLTLFFPHDTPQFSISQNKEEQARQFLTTIYQNKNDIQSQLENFSIEVDIQQKSTDTWASIFNKQNITRIKLGSVLSAIFQLSGVSAITFYSQIIFIKATGSKQTASTMSVIYSLLYIICSFFSGSLIKKYGRKPLLIYGNLIITAILASIGVISYMIREDVENGTISLFSSILQITLVFMFVIVLNISCGTAKWVYNADILKGKAISFATCWNFISGFIVAMAFPIGQEKWGIYTMFFIFAILLFICVLYCWPILIETKGLSRIEIEEQFQLLDAKSLSKKTLQQQSIQQQQEKQIQNSKQQQQQQLQLQNLDDELDICRKTTVWNNINTQNSQYPTIQTEENQQDVLPLNIINNPKIKIIKQEQQPKLQQQKQQ